MTIPTRVNVVACQLTAEITWRLVNPSTFKSPVSLWRRDTLTTSKWASVAAPKIATIAPKINGKLIASPKLIRDVGVTGSVAYNGYVSQIVGYRRLPPPTGHHLGHDGAEVGADDCLSARFLVRTRRACGSLEARDGDHGAIAQARIPLDDREGNLGYNPERFGAFGPRWRGHGDVDQRTHMGIYLAHGCRTQANLAIAIR